MASRDFSLLTGFANGNTPEIDILELPDFNSNPAKSDFYINPPAIKVDRLVIDAENELLRKLVSFAGQARRFSPPAIEDLDDLDIDDSVKSVTRNNVTTKNNYLLKKKLLENALAATIGTVSARFRKSNIETFTRYLISNEAIYTYCLSLAYFDDKIKDAEGLFSRVLVYAGEVRKHLNRRIAETFFEDNKLNKDEVPAYDSFIESVTDSTFSYAAGKVAAYLQNELGKLVKYDGLLVLVDKYIKKGEVDPDRITPDIKTKMIEHLSKMGVQVSAEQAQKSAAKYDEYLAIAYSQARKLSGGGFDPVKNMYSDVSVDTFDYKVDYFETIEEQSIDRSNILGAAVLFYTKVLSDDLGLLRIADAIIMAWTQGKLDIPHGETATKLYRYYKLRKERMSAEERSMFYKIVFNTGSAEVLENSVVNTDFPRLWNSLMQESVKYIQKMEENDTEEYISKIGVYNSVKNLQYNLSVFMTGMIRSLLPEMYAQLQSAIDIIRQPEVVSQLGQGYQRNMWKVVERIGADVFNTVPNVSALKTIAIKGHSIFSTIAAFDESQLSEEAFRRLMGDVEEFIVANGQVDGKPLGENEEDEEEMEEEEEETIGTRNKGKKDNWDF